MTFTTKLTIVIVMNEPGYLYVLINPSMEGLVKIGRTVRDPEGRAQELSGATGVPTPFAVAYYRRFEDSLAAEQFVHAFLSHRGARVSTSREFFKTSPKEAIDAILQAHDELNARSDAEEGAAVAPAVDKNGEPPWLEVLRLAEKARYGDDETFPDEREALALYKQAAQLGGAAAYLGMGQLLLANPQLGPVDDALRYLQKGGLAGVFECYAEIAMAFAQKGDAVNAERAWEKYFVLEPGEAADTCGKYGFEYLSCIAQYRSAPTFVDILRRYRDQVAAYLEGLEAYAERQHQPGLWNVMRAIMLRHLFPERAQPRLAGRIKWWNVGKDYGFVTLSDGRDVFLPGKLVEPRTIPKSGQRIECDVVELETGRPMAVNVVLLS